MASKAIEKLLKELWESELYTEEDILTLRSLFDMIDRAVSPSTIQMELSEETKYRHQASSLWRRARKSRELAEEELDYQFYTHYNSLRTLKDAEVDQKETETLALPELKSRAKAKKQDAPRGHFSKDLVKAYAFTQQPYQCQSKLVINLRYFEGEMEDLYKAFQDRHSSLCQWSNNYRRLYGEDV